MNPVRKLKNWFDSESFGEDLVTVMFISFVVGVWSANEGFTVIASISLSILAFLVIAPLALLLVAILFRG